MKKVDRAFVLNVSGIPFRTFEFHPGGSEVDNTLMTGFLTAIQSFAGEVFKMQSDQFLIDNGKHRITLFKNHQLTLAIISEENFLPFKDEFVKFLDLVIERYPSFNSGLELNAELPVFIDLRKKLVNILFREPIAEDWIPIPHKLTPQYLPLVQKYPLLGIIDGQQEIQHLPGYYEETREEIYETLNYAFYEHVISFKNMLEPKDYVVATPHIRILIPEREATRVQFQDLFPSIDFTHLVLDLEQVCRIDKLGHEQGDNLIPALEWMFNENLIQIIGEVPRKLFISIDIADNLLEILHKLAGQKNVERAVRKIIFNRNIPAIAGRVQFHDGRVIARIDKYLLLVIKPEEIEQFAQQWIYFAQELVVDFYPLFKGKFVTQFYDLLVEQYLKVFHKRDLDLLTPILTKLEEFHVL